MNDKRQKYTLGHGVYAGEIILENGEPIWVEYLPILISRAVSSLEHVQDFLEYIAACICEQEPYNHIQIKSIIHRSTIKNGQRVPDRLGWHMTFAAANYCNDVMTESRTGHAYISDLDLNADSELWYEHCELVRVRWNDETGSSQVSQNFGEDNMQE